MTAATIALKEPAEKGADIDVLRQMVQFTGVRHFEAVFREFRHARLSKSSTYKRSDDFWVVARYAASGIGIERGV